MRIPNIYINDIHEKVNVYIIGYKSKGESILLTIGENFSLVVDSYKTKKDFVTEDLIKKLRIEELSLLCWTHPDEDHTKGLSELFKYVKSNTKVVIPQGISVREIKKSLNNSHLINPEDEYYKIYEKIHSMGDSINLIEANHGTSFEFNLIHGESYYPCKIEFFAPVSSLVRQCQIDNIQSILEKKDVSEYLNLYSLALKLSIGLGNISLCFTGDLDDDSITLFEQDKSYFKDVILSYNDVFKIPHHGSSNSSLMLNYVERFNYAVVTCFRGKRMLPEQDIMEQYNRKKGDQGKLLTTRRKAPIQDYGIVHIEIPLFDPNNSKCNCLNDACPWGI